MEKWKKRYIVITAIIFAITCVATVLFAYNVNQLSIGMVEVIKTILSFIDSSGYDSIFCYLWNFYYETRYP
jgi:hypothetical protein